MSDENETNKSPALSRTEDILCKIAHKSSEDVLNRMEKVNRQQKDVQAVLSSVLKTFESQDFQVIIGERIVNSTTFRSKLQGLRISMFKISERSVRLQARLNYLRKECTPQNALVKTGPFFYRCVYKGGVRFREYPSSTARVTGSVINLNSVVGVVERVFITGESSVFLHVKGVGWLLENKDSLVCMERCAPPTLIPPPVTTSVSSVIPSTPGSQVPGGKIVPSFTPEKSQDKIGGEHPSEE